MKSITIHGVDEQLARMIKSKADADGRSVNNTVKNLLEQALGIKPTSARLHERDFIELCGVRSDTDLTDFNDVTGDTGNINPADWR